MTVRVASPEDHDNILKVAKQSRYTSDFSNRVMFSSDAAYAKGWIVLSERAAVMGPGDGELQNPVAGFYCVRHKVREPVTSLYFITVDKEVRGHGVGQELMKHLAEQARPTIRLNCMKENEQALKFYDMLGFERVGEAIQNQAWSLEIETRLLKLFWRKT